MSGGRRPRRQPLPANVRFYCDADVIGLAKLLQQVRVDVTYPGDPGGVFKRRLRPPCPITQPKTPDSVWIPIVASNGWVILTRDKKIAERPAERQAVVDHRAKLVAITSHEKLDLWRQLEIVLNQWRVIERVSTFPGPFMYSITRTSIRSLLGTPVGATTPAP